MANNTYHSILVTAFNGDEETDPLFKVHKIAQELFEPDLVSPLSGVGHNSMNSFCVFPNGSGSKRPAETEHRKAIERFVGVLKEADVNYAVIYWSDDDGSSPCVIGSHDEPLDMKKRLQL